MDYAENLFQRGTQVAEENEGAPQFGRKARRQEEGEEEVGTGMLPIAGLILGAVVDKTQL